MKQYLNKTASVNQFHRIIAKIFHGIFYLLLAPSIIYLPICKFIRENQAVEYIYNLGNHTFLEPI